MKAIRRTVMVTGLAGWVFLVAFTIWMSTFEGPADAITYRFDKWIICPLGVQLNLETWDKITRFAASIPLITVGYSVLVGLVLCVVYVLPALRRAVREPNPGFCGRCRYDLTANESGVCPECGTAIGSVPSTRFSQRRLRAGLLGGAPLLVSLVLPFVNSYSSYRMNPAQQLGVLCGVGSIVLGLTEFHRPASEGTRDGVTIGLALIVGGVLGIVLNLTLISVC